MSQAGSVFSLGTSGGARVVETTGGILFSSNLKFVVSIDCNLCVTYIHTHTYSHVIYSEQANTHA